jgi:hypothetical protein
MAELSPASATVSVGAPERPGRWNQSHRGGSD